MSEMNEEIVHVDGKWKVFPKKPKKGDKKRKALGTHDTREEAVAQLRAIEISKHESQVYTFDQFINERKKESVNPAYLTKDAAEMKSEIRKNAKKSDDDSTAYVSDPKGGWKADYSASGKRYETKPSKYTKAFAKKYGKDA
jgi:hypothetical protein